MKIILQGFITFGLSVLCCLHTIDRCIGICMPHCQHFSVEKQFSESRLHATVDAEFCYQQRIVTKPSKSPNVSVLSFHEMVPVWTRPPKSALIKCTGTKGNVSVKHASAARK